MTHRWAPDSPCGPGCLPRPGSVRRAGTHRVALRLAGAAGLMLAGIGVAVVFALLWRSARTALVRSWFRALLRVLGIRTPTAQDMALVRLLLQLWYGVLQASLNAGVSIVDAESDIRMGAELLLAPRSNSCDRN